MFNEVNKINSVEIKVHGVDKVRTIYYDTDTYENLELKEYPNVYVVSYKYYKGIREVIYPLCNVLSVDIIKEQE